MRNQKPIQVLLIEDEDYDVRRVRKTVDPFRERINIKKVVADGQSALDILRKEEGLYDVVIMDYQIVGGISGETLIRKIKEINATLQIIVITKMTINITDFDFANRLLEAGAMWYGTKYPGDIEDFIYQPTDFILSILNAYEKKLLHTEHLQSSIKLRENIQSILDRREIIGASEPIVRLKEQINKISAQDATIMITGESGTGKELVANHIHYKSKRRFEKLVTINCGSLPDELIESELFGFEKGSFTGAHSQKLGLFQAADKGSIFLDEVGELPLSAQVKLLRVLQEGEIDKIGRTEKIKVDVRIIAATNKNLQDAIKDKKFREDLFYRLNVVNINVPSLRERSQDIPMLAEHFMNKFGTLMSVDQPQFAPGAMDYLKSLEWPGNVRQLQNVIQRLLFMCEGQISVSDIQTALGQRGSATLPALSVFARWSSESIKPWRDMERSFKKEYFNFVRKNTTSDAEAARMLGLAPPNYHRMCKELGIK